MNIGGKAEEELSRRVDNYELFLQPHGQKGANNA